LVAHAQPFFHLANCKTAVFRTESKVVPVVAKTIAEREQLNAEIHSFLTASTGRRRGTKYWDIVTKLPLGAKTELTSQKLRDLQQETKQFLDDVLQKEQGVKATASVEISGTYQLWRPDQVQFLIVEGSVREMFFLVLHLLIIRGADEELRSCPECHKIFLRTGKQIYCGHRCKGRANIRAWRQTPQGKAAKVCSSRMHYEHKVRQQPGKQNVTINVYKKRRGS
jgi:hypothetical protein